MIGINRKVDACHMSYHGLTTIVYVTPSVTETLNHCLNPQLIRESLKSEIKNSNQKVEKLSDDCGPNGPVPEF
jgi:hypothetical protein